MDKFGLNGLLDVIRMENNDKTAVALGNDLSGLGLEGHRLKGQVLKMTQIEKSKSIQMKVIHDALLTP